MGASVDLIQAVVYIATPENGNYLGPLHEKLIARQISLSEGEGLGVGRHGSQCRPKREESAVFYEPMLFCRHCPFNACSDEFLKQNDAIDEHAQCIHEELGRV